MEPDLLAGIKFCGCNTLCLLNQFVLPDRIVWFAKTSLFLRKQIEWLEKIVWLEPCCLARIILCDRSHVPCLGTRLSGQIECFWQDLGCLIILWYWYWCWRILYILLYAYYNLCRFGLFLLKPYCQFHLAKYHHNHQRLINNYRCT